MFAQFVGSQQDALSHDFARLEFDDGARRDRHICLGFVGVAANALFGEADFKNPEISQLDIMAEGEIFDDVIKGLLDNGKSLFLSDANFFGDTDDHVALGEIRHIGDVAISWWDLKAY